MPNLQDEDLAATVYGLLRSGDDDPPQRARSDRERGHGGRSTCCQLSRAPRMACRLALRAISVNARISLTAAFARDVRADTTSITIIRESSARWSDARRTPISRAA